jgi:hypothetical protein
MIDKNYHSPFSPSSAERFFNCPRSISLSAGMPDTSSKYAEMGTSAHEAASEFLLNGTLWGEDEFEGLETYTSLCVELMLDASFYKIEERVHVTPELSGTPDFVAVVKGILYVVDLKFGYEYVDPKKNKQLLYYALAAVKQYDLSFTSAALIIVQPKMENSKVNTYTATVEEVLEFEEELVKAVALAKTKEAPIRLGDHCKYCKGAPVCPARKEEMKQMLMFSDNIDCADLGWVLDHEASIKEYIESVKELALIHPPKGWKVADGVSRRYWKKGVDLPPALLELSPVTISKAEKLKIDINEFVEVRVGTPRLVKSLSTLLDESKE